MQIKKLLLPLVLVVLSVPALTQPVVYSRYTEMNVNVPFWIAFTDNIDGSSWNSGTTLTMTGGCSPSIISSYFKAANYPFNHDEIMALVNPGTCPGTITATDSVYSLSTTLTVRNPETFYVRPDGNTRYTNLSMSGHCSGLGDQSYAAAGGSGVNQNCAMGDLRYLWINAFTYDASPESMFNFIQIAGGDTVIVRGAHNDSTSWRIGQSGPNSGDYFFLAGDNRETWMPALPNGTASFPTKFLGENYASCSDIDPTHGVTTHLNGGYGVVAGINLANQSMDHVNINCFDLDDHESCGVSTNVDGCSSSFPVSDYMVNGVLVSNLMTNTTIQNFSEHGAGADAMNGPTGDGTVFLNTRWFGNAGDGWNEDNGTTDQRNVFLGTTIIRNYVFGWNGCAEQWPITGSSAVYGDCTDQGSGGAGDAFGTATLANLTPGHVWFDQGTIFNNTQDGWDALHLHGAGSTMTITRGLGYSNMGDQVKIGGTGGLVANTISMGNCTAMAYWQPGMVPPEATITGYTTNGTTAFFTTAPGNTIIAGRSYGLSNFVNGTFFNGNTKVVASATGLSGTTWQAPFSSSVTSGSEPGAYASSANGRIGDFCRGVYANVYETDSNTVSGWYFNTAYSSANVTVAAIGNTTPGDTTQVFQFQNNVAVNFVSAAGSATFSNPIEADFGTNPFTNPGGAMAYNLTFQWPGGWSCPNTSLGETHALCVSPLLTDQTDVLYGLPPSGVNSFVPQSGSPVLASGAAISALTDCVDPLGGNPCLVDYFGNARSTTHPSMGAIEGTSTTVATPSASPVAGTYGSTQNVTLSTSTGGATICYTTDGSTPTETANACSGGTTQTYTTPITVSTTTTIKALGTLSGLTNSGFFTGLYTITLSSTQTSRRGVLQ